MHPVLCSTGPTTLVLASTSRYRKALLERLGLPFDVVRPNVDETVLSDEAGIALVQRLALAKAQAVAKDLPKHLVIGSDQVACIDGHILGKPGSRTNAIAQLEAASGKTVEFQTGLTLLNTSNGSSQTTTVPYLVTFRNLTIAEIERYVDAEQPFDCAGSFKSEGLGITLFKRMAGDDPNALVGLPLIALCDMLRQEGVRLP